MEQLADRRKGLHLPISIIPLVFAVAMAWATATLSLRGKVDRETYNSDRAQQATADTARARDLRELTREVKALRSWLCRGHENEFGCQP